VTGARPASRGRFARTRRILVGQDTAALGDAAEREHDGVDLMRVRIDASLTLRRSRAGLLVGAAPADEIFRLETPLDRVNQAVAHAQITPVPSVSHSS
jgi:hypothetical protein